MARQPIVAGDSGGWGAILNAYLSVEHNGDGTHGTMTSNGTLTFTQSQGNGCIIFPDPTAGNSNPIIWKDAGGKWPQLKSNSAAVGLTETLTSGAFTHTILRQDIGAGTREIGRMTWEAANAAGGAFRPGYVVVQQTDNTAAAESGYLSLFSRFSGSDNEQVRVGDMSVAVMRIMNASLQLTIEFNATNKLMFQHNGTNGYIGTQTNQPLILRQNNADAIQITSVGNIVFKSYGSGTGAVTVGAADSGGAGFKLLRVPN